MCDEGCVVVVIIIIMMISVVGRLEKNGMNVWCRSRFEKEGEGGDEVRGRRRGEEG